jgi:hypothetical protein
VSTLVTVDVDGYVDSCSFYAYCLQATYEAQHVRVHMCLPCLHINLHILYSPESRLQMYYTEMLRCGSHKMQLTC